MSDGNRTRSGDEEARDLARELRDQDQRRLKTLEDLQREQLVLLTRIDTNVTGLPSRVASLEENRSKQNGFLAALGLAWGVIETVAHGDWLSRLFHH